MLLLAFLIMGCASNGCGLYGPRCLLSSKRRINLIFLSLPFKWVHVWMAGSMEYIVITSWHGNVFCITSLLWGETIGHWWTFLTKGQERGLRFWLFVRGTIDHRWIPSQRAWNAGFDVCLNSRLNKQSSCVTSDLRSCDVNVIYMSKDVTTL